MTLNLKILHICDDDKFLSYSHWQFEDIFPNNNLFTIITDNMDVKSLRFIKHSSNIKLIKNDSKALKQVIELAESYDLVVLHGLNRFRSLLALNIYRDKKLLWLFWGSEVYNNYFFDLSSPYGTKTKFHFAKSSYIINLKKYLYLFYNKIFPVKTEKYIIYRAIQKIQYIGTFIPEEYEMLKNKGVLKAKLFNYSYSNIEFIMKENMDKLSSGNNILLGNSSFRTNNHLEGFDILKGIDLSNSKIISPLSYGQDYYRKKIISVGKNLFGDKFIPITDFLALKDYNDLISTCQIAVMPLLRQQALGNIISLIWMGTKVFLHESTTSYAYFKRLGISIYSIEKDLKENNNDIFTPLDFSTVKKDRDILLKNLSTNVLSIDLKNQIEKIVSNEF